MEASRLWRQSVEAAHKVFKELFNTEMYEHTQTHNTTETLEPKLIRSQISLMAESVGCLVESWSPDSSQICITVIALIRVSESCVLVYLLQLSPPGKGLIQILQSLIDYQKTGSALYKCIVVHPQSQNQGLDI